MVARARSRTRGMAMVELVIVLPVLLLILFAIAEYSVALGRWLAVNNAAREGARLAVVFRTTCDPLQVESEVVARVESYVATLGIAPQDVTVNVANQCVANANSTVTVQSDYAFRVVPGLSQVGPTLALNGTSTMRNEGS